MWKPKHIFRFEPEAGQTLTQQPTTVQRYSIGKIAKAWSPFAILTVMVTIWSVKPFKALFAKDGALEHWIFKLEVPYLHKLVEKMPPIVSEIKPYEAIYKFDWFSATGTAILLLRSSQLFS